LTTVPAAGVMFLGLGCKCGDETVGAFLGSSFENLRLISERILVILCRLRMLCIEGRLKRARSVRIGMARSSLESRALWKISCSSWRSSERALVKREAGELASLGRSGLFTGVG